MAAMPFFLQATWLCVMLLVLVVVGHSSTVAGRDAPSGSSSFSLDVVRNPKFARNGPLAYTKALQKFGGSLDDFPDIEVKGSVGSVPAWNQTYDREYLSPVFVGTPPQMLMLDLDTGSSDLWVFSTETTELAPGPGLGNRHIYKPNVSETSTRVVNHTWYIQYGDQSFARGFVFADDVQLGEITIKNATIETAITASPTILNDTSISGLMGLAFNHSSTILPRGLPTLLQQLSAEHGVDLFTVDLKYHDDGKYTFGAIDDAAYTGAISWQPLLPDSQFWHIHLTAFQVGGTDTRLIYRWPVILDTGTTLLLLQADLAQLYWDQVPGAVYDYVAPGWLFPCNASAALPDLLFGFHDDGWTGVIPGRYMNYEELKGGMCYGGVQSNNGLEFAILGDVLLKSVFVVFDGANERVGFARKELY